METTYSATMTACRDIAIGGPHEECGPVAVSHRRIGLVSTADHHVGAGVVVATHDSAAHTTPATGHDDDFAGKIDLRHEVGAFLGSSAPNLGGEAV